MKLKESIMSRLQEQQNAPEPTPKMVKRKPSE